MNLCWVQWSDAQDIQQNLDKYWNYRDRLLEHFLVLGDQQGMCMPAERIDTISDVMKWADNTVWLGWYIGVLSTEHFLLTNQHYYKYDSQDSARLSQNIKELYFSIKSLIRLDLNAETHFPAPCDSIPDLRNGFFLRDDVPDGFDSLFAGINGVQSDFNNSSLYINEMSQDQAYHVLLGLSLAKRFLPDNLSYQNMDLKQEALDQVSLIGAWIHQDGWIIKNPSCQFKNVDRGENATLLSKGLNLALQYISDGTINYDSDVTTINASIWDGLNSPVLLTPDNMHMTMTLAAIGMGWGNPTLDGLMTLAEVHRWHAYTLLHVALYDTNSVSNYHVHKNEINFWTDSMLNEAPFGGPYSTSPAPNDHGYGVNNRFIRPRADHYVGSPGSAGYLWNGIDYMLLHNLSLICNPWKWPYVDTTSIIDTTSNVDTTTSLTNTTFNYQLKLYPNPARSILQISGLPIQSTTGIRITAYNSLGKEILESIQKPQSTTVYLDIAGMKSGIYFLEIARDNKSQAKQFVVW